MSPPFLVHSPKERSPKLPWMIVPCHSFSILKFTCTELLNGQDKNRRNICFHDMCHVARYNRSTVAKSVIPHLLHGCVWVFFYLAMINDLIHNILRAFFFLSFSQLQPLHQKSWHKISGALLVLSKEGFMLQKISVLSQLMITVLR